MKPSLLLIALVAGGLAGAGSAFLVRTPESVKSDRHTPAAPGAGAGHEIADLRAKNVDLEERLRLLERQLAMQADSRSSAVNETPNSVAQLDVEGLAELLASLNEPDKPAPAGLATMVERAIEDKEEREQQERDAERQAQREQRLDERMNEMADKLGLDQGQKNSLRTSLLERDEARGEFFESLRNGGGGFGAGMDRDGMRTAMEEITNKSNMAIQSSLSPAQYEQYQEEYSDSGFGRGGWGGGRGGSDRGRGN
jgi:gas vesicle protein